MCGGNFLLSNLLYKLGEGLPNDSFERGIIDYIVSFTVQTEIAEMMLSL